MNAQDLCLKAIEVDPKCATAYFYLSTTLKKDEFINVPGYTAQMNKQDLFIKTIELDRNFSRAYISLAQTLDEDESINIKEVQVTQQQLYLVSLRANPSGSNPAWFYIAETLKKEGKISINGMQMSKKDIGIKLSKMDNSDMPETEIRPMLKKR